MALALEVLIVPVLLLTIIGLIVFAELGPVGALVGAVAIGMLYFVFITALRAARREEPQPGRDQGTRDDDAVD